VLWVPYGDLWIGWAAVRVWPVIKRLSLAHTAEDEAESRLPDLVIPRSAAIFEPIATFLMATVGFAALAEAYNSPERLARPWALNDHAVFDARACELRLRIAPAQIVTRMVQNWWPESISFECTSVPPSGAPPRLNLGSLEHFLFGLSQAMFTSFFENQRDAIQGVYGKRWPVAWAFGRVVRNALSHGGNLEIRHPTNVRWKKLAYTQADHGRRIVNVDLWPGDLFVLLTEMEAELPTESGAKTGVQGSQLPM
jgi:hypothetical protein